MKVCIIGAGITGLATAWQMQRNGADCLVLEPSQRVGGSIQSVRRDGFLAEEGPNSLQLNSVAIEDFLASIPGLETQIVEASPTAKKRYIVRQGRPHAVPTGPMEALTTPLWSFGGKLRVLREPFIRPAPPEAEESVADFVRRRLGDELYRYAINPLVGGIYEGDPERLSLPYGFPKLHALEQGHGGLIRGALAKMWAARRSTGRKPNKRILSFREGIDALPRTIAAALGNAVRTGVSVESIRRIGDRWMVRADGNVDTFDQVVLTTPAHALAFLPLDSELSDDLKKLGRIEYPPVSVLSLGYRRDQIDHPLDGFGALVPESEGHRILGVLFPSSVFPDRAPRDHVLLTVFVGGTRQPELATEATDALIETVRPDLENLLGTSGEPTFIHHKHWAKAIPQYTLGYGTFLTEIKTIEKAHPGLRLLGNYRSGISLTYCLEAALNA